MNYQRGRRLEWQVRKDLEAAGWAAMRTAGSHGISDIIAIKAFTDYTEIKLIQCKVTKKPSNVGRLLREFERSCDPLKASIVGPIRLRLELIVKLHGSNGYEVHPLGE